MVQQRRGQWRTAAAARQSKENGGVRKAKQRERWRRRRRRTTERPGCSGGTAGKRRGVEETEGRYRRWLDNNDG